MKILLLFACFALATTSYAAPSKKRAPKSEEGQTPHILQMDEDFPIERLKQEGVVLHPLSEVRKKEKALPVRLQDQFFEECGLGAIVRNWSGFEKDRLALRAENQEPAEVAERYDGRLPEASIRKLKKIILEYRRSQQ